MISFNKNDRATKIGSEQNSQQHINEVDSHVTRVKRSL